MTINFKLFKPARTFLLISIKQPHNKKAENQPKVRFFLWI